MRQPILLAALFLTACSGKGEDNAAAPIGDEAAAPGSIPALASGTRACDVIDKASVDAAMGRDMGQPSSDTDTMCQYTWSGEKLSDQAMATLTIHAVPLSSLEPGVKSEGGTMEPMEALGDRAFYSPQFGLYVEHKGRSGIYLAGAGMSMGEGEANKAKMVALARATVGKL